MTNEDHQLPGRSHPVHLPVMQDGFRSVIVFVTVCTKNRKPILANSQVHDLLKNVWKASRHWQVGRYVIMPEHIHLFCCPGVPDFPSLKVWMRHWRAEASRHWPSPDEQPVWQLDFWDRQLRKGESYSEKWHYVRQNPVRKGLCAAMEGWPYQGEMNALMWHD